MFGVNFAPGYPRRYLANTMTNHFIIASLIPFSLSVALFAQSDVKPTTNVLPILVRDAIVNSNRIGPKKYWLIGVEHSTRVGKQTYVVMVPGSEGGASRYEQRTRDVQTPFPIPHRYSVDEITFTDLGGKAISREAAINSINKNHSFLFVPVGKTVSKTDRNLFDAGQVLVTPKTKR